MEPKWNKTCAILKPTIQVKITKEDVLDIICSAVNGGVGYWAAVSADDNDYSEAKKHLVEQGADLKDVCFEEVFTQILFDGKELEVLVEEVVHKTENGHKNTYLRGHTERYMDILINIGDTSMPESFINSFVYVKYTKDGDIMLV